MMRLSGKLLLRCMILGMVFLAILWVAVDSPFPEDSHLLLAEAEEDPSDSTRLDIYRKLVYGLAATPSLDGVEPQDILNADSSGILRFESIMQETQSQQALVDVLISGVDLADGSLHDPMALPMAGIHHVRELVVLRACLHARAQRSREALEEYIGLLRLAHALHSNRASWLSAFYARGAKADAYRALFHSLRACPADRSQLLNLRQQVRALRFSRDDAVAVIKREYTEWRTMILECEVGLLEKRNRTLQVHLQNYELILEDLERTGVDWQSVVHAKRHQESTLSYLLGVHHPPRTEIYGEFLADMQALECLADVMVNVFLFEAERGRFPTTLTEMIPEYITEIPKSPYDGSTLRYRSSPLGLSMTAGEGDTIYIPRLPRDW